MFQRDGRSHSAALLIISLYRENDADADFAQSRLMITEPLQLLLHAELCMLPIFWVAKEAANSGPAA